MKVRVVVLLMVLLSATAVIPAAEKDDKSKYISQIYKSYPEARNLSAPSLMRWDFSKGKEYEYSFRGESEMTMNSNFHTQTAPQPERDPFRVNSEGKITIRSKQNLTADLIFQQSVLESEFEEKSGLRMQAQEPTVLQGMKEDGSMEVPQASGDLLLQMLFPLPPGELLTGQFADIPIALPFNAGGSLLNVKGRNRMTLKKYVTIDNRTYAELESDFLVNQLDVPPEMKGKYVCYLRGAAVFYFDVEGRSFHSGRVALLISMDMETPTPKIDWKGAETEGFQMPDTTKMSMRTDQFFEIIKETRRP